jgi:hypothetical protein
MRRYLLLFANPAQLFPINFRKGEQTSRWLMHPQQIAKAISDHPAQDAIFTCDVGLPTVCTAPPGNEPQPAADRVVLAWLDGQCAGARDRCSGGVPRPADCLAVG